MVVRTAAGKEMVRSMTNRKYGAEDL